MEHRDGVDRAQKPFEKQGLDPSQAASRMNTTHFENERLDHLGHYGRHRIHPRKWGKAKQAVGKSKKKQRVE